ncbi:hypothetical protein pb186bvf_015034 [Paramecium bursaria]
MKILILQNKIEFNKLLNTFIQFQIISIDSLDQSIRLIRHIRLLNFA